MTSQDKKRWLLLYRELDREITRSLEEVSRLRSLCERVTPTLTGQPHGTNGASREDSIVRLAELTRELNLKIDQYVDMRREIEHAIERVRDTRYRTLLRLRYIDGLPWQKVSERMNYSVRSVIYLHGGALADLPAPILRPADL